MWTEPTMPFGQSVIVSLLGLSVPFGSFPGSDLSGSGNYGNFQNSPLRCF